ncbi:cytochrome c oxidase assembly protein [Azospirillum brasilense]|uniref:Cytochrome c oxidase assembly protein CtaG n=1 Tax=Azospirillum brasilense TaxID=192 RepID=A0A0P0EAJ0_AZOBR|nr:MULTISPECIES: cytochrome c oxidase assembly protein [Azospirillum]ALJ35641.1 cytochrome C oxidase assembly protein [Azospirillum brasilense]MDW7554897.1 cytochrome c oxidase assembly protein [Azospirillum brasilense]MDW7594674.1 cytochrome c oxidase assembly protein [Azospirillum brasilense]MDW7629528.1 cytochrome c oxidase assembly protein [Azospirillum brasilense]MDX5954388.1 cytochrome c oxidase assembly protein [Azospirillum brasilense]
MNDRREGDKGLRRKNRLFMAGLFGLVFGMVGLAYASVPLYALFCQVTGFGGTTQRADAAPARQVDRVIKVRFNADVNQSLPWRFKPEQKELTVKLGEMGLAAYQAANRVDRPTVGTALYNVTPDKVGKYFNKIECFCFTEQVLEPGQSVDMPVAFFVDPALAGDPAMEDVTTITLSYTFFRAKDETQVLAQHATQAAGPKGTGTAAN